MSCAVYDCHRPRLVVPANGVPEREAPFCAEHEAGFLASPEGKRGEAGRSDWRDRLWKESYAEETKRFHGVTATPVAPTGDPPQSTAA